MRYLSLVLLALTANTLYAQDKVTGYTPEQSPYRDLEFKQDIGAFVGYYSASKDNAGVAPQSALMEGLRYEVRISGPATFATRFARVNSEREALDPTQPSGSRNLGKFSDPIYLIDLGFNFNVTGQKTWHNITPVTGFAIGIVSDFGHNVPKDPFRFGTNFEMSLNLGFRYIRPNTRWQLRGEATNFLHQMKYPNAYYTPVAGTQIVPNSQSKTFWKNNMAYTLGLSYMFFR